MLGRIEVHPFVIMVPTFKSEGPRMPVVFARNMRGIPHFNRRMPNHHTNGRILIGFESPFNARVDTMVNDLGIWNMAKSVGMRAAGEGVLE